MWCCPVFLIFEFSSPFSERRPNVIVVVVAILIAIVI